MRLFLIRHGETVDNVAGLYAGSRDSELTNHGIQQARHLGRYLKETRPELTHIFASPLQRAFKTADALRAAQATLRDGERDPLPSVIDATGLSVVQVDQLVEQDFGFYEGKPFYARPRDSGKTGREAHYDDHKHEPGFVDVESKDSLAARSDLFLQTHLLPLLDQDGAPTELCVAVVSHGILLSQLWRRLLRRLPQKSVSIMPEVIAAKGQIVLEHLGGWSNTGFLELSIRHTLLSYDALPQTCSDSHPQAVAGETTGTGTDNLDTDPGWPSSPSHESSGDTSSVHVNLREMQSCEADVEEISATSSVVVRPRAQSLSDKHNNVEAPPATAISSPYSGIHVRLQPGDRPSITLDGYITNVLTINGQEHVRGLKRTRGGIGRARYDEGQKTIETFFKRARKG